MIHSIESNAHTPFFSINTVSDPDRPSEIMRIFPGQNIKIGVLWMSVSSLVSTHTGFDIGVEELVLQQGRWRYKHPRILGTGNAGIQRRLYTRVCFCWKDGLDRMREGMVLNSRERGFRAGDLHGIDPGRELSDSGEALFTP